MVERSEETQDGVRVWLFYRQEVKEKPCLTWFKVKLGNHIPSPRALQEERKKTEMALPVQGGAGTAVALGAHGYTRGPEGLLVAVSMNMSGVRSQNQRGS